MKRAGAFLLLFVVGCGLGCGKSPSDPPGPAELFEGFWLSFDAEYPFFPLKGIDWDSLGDAHRPRVAPSADLEELVAVLREMAMPLRDLHVAFTSPAGVRIPTYVPDAFVNWDRDVWLDRVTAAGWTQVKPNLGYARLEGVPYVTIGAWNRAQFSEADFDSVLEQFEGAAALVLDVRPNPGGDEALAIAVAGRFADEEVSYGSVQYRDGPAHDDFGPLQERTLVPRGPWTFGGRAYVLAGRGVFSSNESFIAGMRELPRVTVLGDTTGGASANPAVRTLAGGWSFTVSRWIARTADGAIIEDGGIPPDVFVGTAPADFDAGIDPVLERALELARAPSNPS